MALPTHVSTAGAQGASINVNANWPNASILANDIGIESLFLTGGTPAATPPADWTEISNVLVSATARLITIWKRCAAGEADHNWSGISGNRFFISTVIRGCVTTGNPWDVLTDGEEAASTAISIPLGTTVYSDCLYLAHIGRNATGTASGEAAANLSSLTEQYDTPSTNSRIAYTGGLAVAGAGGTLTATTTSSARKLWCALALKSTSSVLGSGNPRRLALMGVGR
jgi:hypothetical protein